MRTYMLFDEQAQTDGSGIDNATCLFAFEAETDAEAVMECKDSYPGYLFESTPNTYRFVVLLPGA